MANHHQRGTGFQPVFIALIAGAALTTRALIRHSRHFDLTNKVALITGGSRGLGLALARQLVASHCKIAICARDPAELDRAAADLGPNVLPLKCDLTSPPQIHSMIAKVRQHFGPIDLLINNAGVIQVGPAEHMTPADFDEALATHFHAPLHTTLSVLPEMIARRSGRIINISSIGGAVPAPHLLPYTASKFALTGFSQGLRTEMTRHNIYVTTVIPGLFRSGSPRNAFFKGQHRKEFAWFDIADSLPGLSVSVDHAARSIIRAMRQGRSNLIIGLPAQLASRFHGLFPSLSTELASLITPLLPSPGGIGSRRAKGSQSQSPLAPSILTTLNDRAAHLNNEIS